MTGPDQTYPAGVHQSRLPVRAGGLGLLVRDDLQLRQYCVQVLRVHERRSRLVPAGGSTQEVVVRPQSRMRQAGTLALVLGVTLPGSGCASPRPELQLPGPTPPAVTLDTSYEIASGVPET